MNLDESMPGTFCPAGVFSRQACSPPSQGGKLFGRPIETDQWRLSHYYNKFFQGSDTAYKDYPGSRPRIHIVQNRHYVCAIDEDKKFPLVAINKPELLRRTYEHLAVCRDPISVFAARDCNDSLAHPGRPLSGGLDHKPHTEQ